MNSDTPIVSPYYNLENVENISKQGEHRDIIGGMWDEIGRLQFSTLTNEGLLPEHKLIDIGCGSFRGGVHFIQYLKSQNYYGIDLNQSLIDVGYKKEIIPAGLQEKAPRSNFHSTENFDLSKFKVKFDYALALSVFTHLPAPIITNCLTSIAPFMAEQGKFYATIFEVPEVNHEGSSILHSPGGIKTYPDRDPYHYKFSKLCSLAASSGWRAQYIEGFNHPRDQKLVLFEVI